MAKASRRTALGSDSGDQTLKDRTEAALVSAVVARAQREIVADVAAGRLPRVASFERVKDHVDAADYLGHLEPTSPFHNRPARATTEEILTRGLWCAKMVNRVQDALDRWLKAGALTPTMGKLATRVYVSVECPFCGFGLNHLNADDPAEDALNGPLAAACESCGAAIRVDAEAVHNAQHECLRLLGEA